MSITISKLNLKADTKLALSVLVLWSVGRIINPLRHIAEASAQGEGPWLTGATFAYIALHVAVFAYAAVLLVRALRTKTGKRRAAPAWELALYGYVLLAIVISLYFILFELGLLPAGLTSSLS